MIMQYDIQQNYSFLESFLTLSVYKNFYTIHEIMNLNHK